MRGRISFALSYLDLYFYCLSACLSPCRALNSFLNVYFLQFW
jgi:hypothetical protein